MRYSGLIFALAVATATVAHAQTGKLVVDVPSLQEAPAKPAAKAKERIVCRSDYAIGSLVRRNRWCATAAEWNQSERAAKIMTDKVQSDKGAYQGGMATDVYIAGGKVVITGH